MLFTFKNPAGRRGFPNRMNSKLTEIKRNLGVESKIIYLRLKVHNPKEY